MGSRGSFGNCFIPHEPIRRLGWQPIRSWNGLQNDRREVEVVQCFLNLESWPTHETGIRVPDRYLKVLLFSANW